MRELTRIRRRQHALDRRAARLAARGAATSDVETVNVVGPEPSNATTTTNGCPESTEILRAATTVSGFRKQRKISNETGRYCDVDRRRSAVVADVATWKTDSVKFDVNVNRLHGDTGPEMEYEPVRSDVCCSPIGHGAIDHYKRRTDECRSKDKSLTTGRLSSFSIDRILSWT